MNEQIDRALSQALACREDNELVLLKLHSLHLALDSVMLTRAASDAEGSQP
jgi:hypothetical protein